MSYSPKHGGGKKQSSKPAESTDSTSVEPFTPQNKKRAKIVAILLLVLFAAGIIVALFFIIITGTEYSIFPQFLQGMHLIIAFLKSCAII